MQYIDLPALVHYLEKLLERKSGFRNDATLLPKMQAELLQISRHDGRKEVGEKHAMVCFILSHILCLDTAANRLVLVQSLAGVSDAAKLDMLLPLIRNVVQGSVAAATEGLRSIDERELYLELLFGAYDRSSRTVVETATTGAWALFLEAVSGRTEKRSSKRPLSAHSTKPASSPLCPPPCARRSTCISPTSSPTRRCPPRPRWARRCASCSWTLRS